MGLMGGAGPTTDITGGYWLRKFPGLYKLAVMLFKTIRKQKFASDEKR